jgi:hypothetical protein
MTRGWFSAVVALAVVSTSMTLAASASAAAVVSGCFTYQGTGVQGLTTALEYQTRTGWAFLGAESTTHMNGCVRYTIRGTWRNLNVRIRAAALLRDGQTIAWASSPTYGRAGYGSYGLGTRALTFYRIPGQDLWNVTGTWLAEMDHPNCSSSSAMQVACYMDDHGMVGNLVSFPDTDRDGTWDLADNWPDDARYH